MSKTRQTEASRWVAETAALPDDEFAQRVPFYVLMGEAVDVAAFFDRYWKHDGDGQTNTLPELRSAGMARLPAATGAEILSLQRAAQDAQSKYLLAASPRPDGSGATIARGQEVLGELTATLSWALDDGGDEGASAKLAAVQGAHRDEPRGADALASALEDYAALGYAYRTKLDGVGSFDRALIDEAKTIAEALRRAPSRGATMTPAARAALAKRNRLLTLLVARVRLVRAAARFVYRNYPDVVREAMSAYERRRNHKRASPTPAPGNAVGAAPTSPAAGASASVSAGR